MSIKWFRIARNDNKHLTVPGTYTIDQYLNYFYLALVDTYDVPEVNDIWMSNLRN